MNHIYYGDGKGKTTAAIGLAVRAAGAGKKVIFCQFMKGGDTSELNILQQIPELHIMRCTREYPFLNQMSDKDKADIISEHNNIIDRLVVDINKTKNTLIVLDEITYPLNYELLSKASVYALLESSHKEDELEVVCTGRNPDDRLIKLADYITEMKLHRHPFEAGIPARAGIEY